MWAEDLLSNFKYSFLIRDPAKAITSIFKHWPQFHPNEVAVVEQRRLFEVHPEFRFVGRSLAGLTTINTAV
jgi:adenylylsulfate kinase